VTGTNSETTLQQKLQAIAKRYIDRTIRETDVLRAHIEACIAGEINRIPDIESIAHRIHGSGAMLGFQDLSEHAAVLERFVMPLRMKPALDADAARDLREKFGAFEQCLQRATTRNAGSSA
jgi:HPt (histidine-containing phosphotransfer) domain-containing protein